MVHICESSPADLPYPAPVAGADPPSPPDQGQAILRIPELCVLVYPTSPECMILSSMFDVLSADEWSAAGPSELWDSSESDSELSEIVNYPTPRQSTHRIPPVMRTGGPT
jgi:hypothetical protein